MGEKLISFLVSTRLTAILFIVFALAMAIGTFIENDYGTVTAKILIYNATWFELILGVFVLNFLFNIKRYNLLKFNKWPVLMLHLSWILIILGAFVTRYIGYEGVMPIRENTSSNTFLSEKTYLTVLVDGEHQGQPARKTIQDDLLLSEHTNNYFELNYEFSGQDFTIEYLDFIEDATEGLVEASTGEKYLKLHRGVMDVTTIDLNSFAQKPCEYSVNVKDSIGIYKETKSAIVHEFIFGNTSKYVFFALALTDEIPSLTVQILQKSKDFLKVNCFNKNSRIFLQLENNKYYVGKTTNLDFRIEQHFNSSGSQWTKKYKPKKPKL